MKIWMLVILMVMCVGLVSAGNLYYNVEVYYEDEGMEIRGVGIETYTWKMYNFHKAERLGTNLLRVVSSGNEVLDEEEFSVPTIVAIDEFDEDDLFATGGEIIEVDNVSFNVYVPYYSEGRELVVYGIDGGEVARKDVGEFSKVGVVGDDEVDKLNSEADERIDTRDEGVVEGLKSYWYLIVILVVLILVLVWVLGGKGKKRK